MKNFFFVTYGGGHVNIIKLVAEELIKRHNVSVKILALTTAFDSIEKEFPDGIVKKISDYKFLFKENIETIERKGLQFLSENHSSTSPLSVEDSKDYIGLSFLDLIIKFGEQKADSLYLEKKRQAFLPTTIIKEILKFEKSDVVIATTSPRFEQASLIAAKELNLKNLQILDLFSDVFPLPEAEHIVVMNDFVKKGLVKKGLKNKKYHVLGQPAIEETVNNVLKINKIETAKKINLNLNKRTLLFATQKLTRVDKNLKISEPIPYDLVYSELFKIFERLHNFFDINILIRIHPNENFNDYSKYFDDYDFLYYCNSFLNLEESIAISDYVLVKTSTVAIESLCSGKTVFTYKHDTEKFYSVPFFTNLPFNYSKNLTELESNLIFSIKKNQIDIPCNNFLTFNSKEQIVELLISL